MCGLVNPLELGCLASELGWWEVLGSYIFPTHFDYCSANRMHWSQKSAFTTSNRMESWRSHSDFSKLQTITCQNRYTHLSTASFETEATLATCWATLWVALLHVVPFSAESSDVDSHIFVQSIGFKSRMWNWLAEKYRVFVRNRFWLL